MRYGPEDWEAWAAALAFVDSALIGVAAFPVEPDVVTAGRRLWTRLEALGRLEASLRGRLALLPPVIEYGRLRKESMEFEAVRRAFRYVFLAPLDEALPGARTGEDGASGRLIVLPPNGDERMWYRVIVDTWHGGES
ncbi:hypothetical protein AB1399_10800 [Hydrogenibacillus schlegelii]|uniref:Uncharacterized protein n=1 Tax=Hydrogenibacillus schlegelii TaxID=1484 RepID=A0A132NB47_HYDSH|nr:hypothetical protein [Hydrogenibacillus schlegelii]KWX07379.1 hypothetical protein TR75_03170 [Hydrogenibacillus schlegelii]MBT9282783.1 hypothetical protein [Hydrogenibacillus schlegelii]OAR03733.1 hypothetical protein SA87_00680 [Hydrogenibacillus schlegelii]